MVRKAALALLLLATPALGQTDSPYLNWVTANAPDGFDIEPDGTIWINVGEPGQANDYSIRADDLQAARDDGKGYYAFWVRGYHKRNPKVNYRVTKTRFTVDCKRELLGTSLTAYYAADGSLLRQAGPTPANYIIPGSYGEQYYRIFCILGDKK